MALKLKKRKQPSREDKPIRERTKIAERVLDDSTLLVLLHLIRKGAFDSLDYAVSQGKEAVLFRATAGKNFVAVKTYKYETSSFKHMYKYIEGDKRFSDAKSGRDEVRIWARKEYANLRLCEGHGVMAPRPLECESNVVVMEFLGENGVPYALLKDVVLEDAAKVFADIAVNMRKTFLAGLVHADLSEFNIVMRRQEPVLIDWGQAVLLHHPQAEAFLLKDAENIVKYFSKLGLAHGVDELLHYVKTGKTASDTTR